MTPAWISLGLAFGMGMIIDGFAGTLGFHTAALVLTAFMRPIIMMIVQPHGGYEENMQPFLSVMGTNWFVFCSLAFLLLHHSVYFFIEVFSFDFFLSTLATIVISTILSLILFLTYQFFLIRSK